MNCRAVVVWVLALGTLAFFGCSMSERDMLERKWQDLCGAGGDLAGGNHWSEEEDLSEDSVFWNSDWQSFFERPPEVLVPFLMEKMNLTNEIAVEVSPWGRTTEGALSVYVLQQLLQVNWNQCPRSFSVLTRYSVIVADEDRNVMPFMLPDIAAREELRQFFQMKFAEMKQGE